MASPLLQGKLHISGMDSRAAALARQWQLGLETIAFSYAPLLDDSAALPRAREEIHGISSLWLHGPFAELIPCAIDPLARDVAMRRFRQALDAWNGARDVLVPGLLILSRCPGAKGKYVF